MFESVRLLSKSLLETGRVDLTAMGVDDGFTKEDAASWEPIHLKTHPRLGPARFAYAPSLLQGLKAESPHVLHVHGLWQYPGYAALKLSRSSKIPYMVSAHGMLEPWSLKQSVIKKELVSLLFHRAFLNEACCIRATSPMEVDSIRLAGFKNPIVLIANGVEIPPELPRRAGPNRKRRALFLSRIHPKKGLVNLIKAWEILQPKDWELVIIGPDEGGHLATLQSLVAAAGLEESIRFPGEAWGEERAREYLAADLFVLPTYSENFGLVVAEALCHGIPVITTKGAPWQDLVDYECGWWIEIGIDPLVSALREALAAPPEELQAMGLRGREMVKSKYAWAPIGEQMADAYEWMIGMRDQPDFVII
ncbi:MAG: glycosyltransferase [Luteolibacter sp.]